MNIAEEDLVGALTGRDGLFSFLQDKLNWPLESESTDYFLYREAEDIPGRAAVTAAVSRLVPATSADFFPVFLVEFSCGFSRTALREILRNIRQEICERTESDWDEVVFVCPVPGADHYSSVRFVHYAERGGRACVRSLGFETGEIAETETLRTVPLPALAVPWNGMEPDWAACKKNWRAAWDVEVLARSFYRDYQRIFDEVCNYYVKRVLGDRYLFTQRLFSRLFFIHFLSKKGWMRFQDRQDYLFALREAADEAGENLFRDRLFWVFFQGLGSIKVPEAYTLAELIEKRGEVPRLNISLFEIADRDDIHRAVFIENEAFDIILDRLFGRYNFTVFESTPDDIEVAIDPETLGRVLEKQVTGRQENGAYYTPRPFIAFMCREALKGYLAARTWERADAITALVDQRNGQAVEDAEAVLNALKSFTCVDPACGSGAYLLGMLQELMALRDSLCVFTDSEEQTRYKRKLEIIEENLFGVDKDAFAVHAAHLRLWLSLLVDGEIEEAVVCEPWAAVEEEAPAGEEETRESKIADEAADAPPSPLELTADHCFLPSLDFKILVGDSLACPDPSGFSGLKSGCDEIIRQFEEKKRLYALPQFIGDKKALAEEIRLLRTEILSRTPGANDSFDWRVDFCSIFNPGNVVRSRTPEYGLRTAALSGFDAVLTNPPNIRPEAVGREYKEKTLKRVFPGMYQSAAEFVTYFYVRAVQLLRRAHGDRNSHDSAAGGMLGFVSSNKWFRSASGTNLRQFIADHCAVQFVTDFGDLPVFESASAYPMIFVAQKGGPTTKAVYAEVKSLSPPYPDVKALIKAVGRPLPKNAISGSGWNLADARSADRIRIMRSKGIPLGEYVNGKVYRGLVTSLNTAYVIDDAKRAELIAAEPKSQELIKPLAVGHDIKRWAMNAQNQWLIVIRLGLDIDQFPAIVDHLNNWERGVFTWQEKSEEGWEPRPVNYQAAFEETKIVFQEVAAFPHFAFDCEGTYINSEVLTIPTSDLFVLTLLNSNHVWEFLQSICPKLPNGALNIQTSSILNIPVPPASDTEKEALAEIARMCLEKRGVGVEREEAEINRRVAALYGV